MSTEPTPSTEQANDPQAKIQRYDIFYVVPCGYKCKTRMDQFTEGNYVLFTDHEREVARYKEALREAIKHLQTYSEVLRFGSFTGPADQYRELAAKLEKELL